MSKRKQSFVSGFVFFVSLLAFVVWSNADTISFLTAADVTNVATMQASPANTPVNTMVRVKGYYNVGDGGDGYWKFSSGSCAVAWCVTNTAGGHWNFASMPPFRGFQLGMQQGNGTDPSGVNEAALNALIGYANTLVVSSNPSGVDVGGGGLTYQINAPINQTVNGIRIHDFRFRALSATNFPCSTAMFNVSGGAFASWIDHMVFDGNRLPINLFMHNVSGNIHFSTLYGYHWSGACDSVTFTASGMSGTRTVLTSNTTGIQTHQVSRGNSGNGIPDRATVIAVSNNTSVTFDKDLTGTPSGTVTLNDDPNGMVIGTTNAGGSYSDINFVEWVVGDAEASVGSDRYGSAIYCTGNNSTTACIDTNINHAELSDGVTTIFMDRGANGLKFTGGVEINNGNWNATEINPSCATMADGTNNLVLDFVDLNGCSVQIHFAGSGLAVHARILAARTQSAGNASLSPSSVVQLWTNQTGANPANVVADAFSADPSGATIVPAEYGPGTWGQIANEITFGGILMNFGIGAEQWSGAHTIAFGDCGLAAQEKTASSTITVPSLMVAFGNSHGCAIYIRPTVTGVTVAVDGSGATLNGGTSAISLNQNAGYILYSDAGGSALQWVLLGGVNGVGVTAPITTTGGSNPTIGVNVATSSTFGVVEAVAQVSHFVVGWINNGGVPQLVQLAFGDLTGSAACSQLPAFTGDTTTSAGSCATSTTKTGGTLFSSLATLLGSVTNQHAVWNGTTWVAASTQTIMGGGSNASQAAATTRYYSLQGMGVNASTEPPAALITPLAGTFKNFYAAVVVAPGGSDTVTFTLRINGATPTNGPSCVITGVAKSCNDTTHSATITAGQTYDVMAVTSTTAAGTSGAPVGIEFDTP